MRIISGTHKGRIITPPANLRARPTTDFAKENIFNVLNNIIDIEGEEILDLFAGTGSISYEFASRGASSVTSVEINTVHYNFIRSTVEKFGFDNIHPVKANAFLYLKNCNKKFDIVFSDAPYDLRNSSDIVDLVFENELLNYDGVFIFEHSGTYDFTGHPHFLEERKYGSVVFAIFTNKSED